MWLSSEAPELCEKRRKTRSVGFHPPPWLGLAWLGLGLAWLGNPVQHPPLAAASSLRPYPHGREGGRKSRKQTDHGTNSSTGIRGDGGRKRPKGERRAARRVGGN